MTLPLLNALLVAVVAGAGWWLGERYDGRR